MTSTPDDQPSRPKLRNRVWVWRDGVCIALHVSEIGEDEKFYLSEQFIHPRRAPDNDGGASK